jgi:hypothetical protein
MKIFERIDVFTINDFVSGHEHFFLAWKLIKDGLVKLINCIILWGKNGAIKEVIIWLGSVCDSWIYRVNQ